MSAAFNAMMEECTKAQLAEMCIDLMGERRRLRDALDEIDRLTDSMFYSTTLAAIHAAIAKAKGDKS